jgi:hypothetical protein
MKTKDNTPVRGSDASGRSVEQPVRSEAVAAFLDKARAVAPSAERGRLIFALDATMSRQPTWDAACTLQAGMFREASAIGGLDVQLVYFRGFSECRASRWVGDAAALTGLMTRISCQGGHTQIGKVLSHVRDETRRRKVAALVFVGDAMEEKLDEICHAAGELGLLGVKAFMFQEGGDPAATAAFREVARLTGGAHAPFDMGAAARLGALLRAAAAYAAGGRPALEKLARTDGEARLLLGQMR